MKKEGGGGSSRGMKQVRPLEPTVHHRNNPKKSTPAKSRVHQVPLDDTLMATADDFLLLELVPLVALELEAELVAEGLLDTVTCPEISEKRVYNEPHFTTEYGQDCEAWPAKNTYTAGRRVGSSSPPRTAVSC
jgi:hypothetical protein